MPSSVAVGGEMTESQSGSIRIRDARTEELDQVSTLIRAAYQEYTDFFPDMAWESYLQDAMDVHSRVGEAELIVAEMDGNVVGTVTFYPEGSRSAGEGWPHGWAGIRLLAVLPNSRGLGIGRALTQECLRRCRKRGIATIGLHTTESMSIARSMYERMGFVREPEFDFRPSEEVVMGYRLDL